MDACASVSLLAAGEVVSAISSVCRVAAYTCACDADDARVRDGGVSCAMLRDCCGGVPESMPPLCAISRQQRPAMTPAESHSALSSRGEDDGGAGEVDAWVEECASHCGGGGLDCLSIMGGSEGLSSARSLESDSGGGESHSWINRASE